MRMSYVISKHSENTSRWLLLEAEYESYPIKTSGVYTCNSCAILRGSCASFQRHYYGRRPPL